MHKSFSASLLSVSLLVSFAFLASARAELPFKLKDIAEALVTRAEMTRAQDARVEKFSNVTFTYPQMKVRGEFYPLANEGQTADVFCKMRGFIESSQHEHDRSYGHFVYVRKNVPYIRRAEEKSASRLTSVSCVAFQKDRTSLARVLHTREGFSPSPLVIETVNGIFEALHLSEIEARLRSFSPEIHASKATLEFDASVSYFDPHLREGRDLKPLPAAKSAQKSFCRKLGFSSFVYEESSANATSLVTCK